MDNLTHSVLGLALGELVERSLPLEQDPARGRTRHRLLLFTSWAASNFPDLDLVLTPLAGRPLGYLLHHRGHTHTLLYAIPQAIALLALTWLLWPAARRLLRDSPVVRLATVGVACLGLLLHLGMDYLNVYGVHPFHPFDSRWLYGDMVFIVEPVFWVAFGTPLAIVATRPFARWLLFALLAGAPLCFALLGYLQWGSLLGLAVLGAVLAWMEHGGGPRDRRALFAGLAAGAGFVVVQAFAVQAARALVVAQVHQRDPASRILDVPLSAFGANPLCWSFVAIESNEAAGSYRLSRGVLSLAPAITPVSSCPSALGGAPGETGIARAAGAAGLVWVWEEAGQIGRLRELRKSNCHLDAWLRFARAPSFQGGRATDLRFGPPDKPNFSTIPFEELAGEPCPSHVPDWGYPRADLLGLR
jgi:inner membrane protein